MAHGRVFPAVSLQGSGNAFASVTVTGGASGARPRLRFRLAISPSGLRRRAHAPVADARGAARECVHRRAGDALSGPRACRSMAPGPVRAASGPRAPTGAQLPPCPNDMATFTNNGAPTSVTISNSTSINTIEFDAAAPAYSFTVQNGATFTSTASAYHPVRRSAGLHVNSGATMAIGERTLLSRSRRWRAAATLQSVTSDPSTTPDYLGKHQHHVLGRHRGAGTLEIDGARSADADRHRAARSAAMSISAIARPMARLTINGGSLTVNDLAQAWWSKAERSPSSMAARCSRRRALCDLSRRIRDGQSRRRHS